jgi:hypothetical protein
MNSFFSAKCWYFFSLSSMGDTGQEYRRLLKIETDLSTGILQKHKWENCMTIYHHSWGYRRNAVKRFSKHR